MALSIPRIGSLKTISKVATLILVSLFTGLGSDGRFPSHSPAGTPAAGLAKLDRVLADASRAGSGAAVGAIVRVRPGTEARVKATLIDAGAIVDSELPVIHALTVRLSPRQLAAVAAGPLVLSISTDGGVQSTAAGVALKPPVYTA